MPRVLVLCSEPQTASSIKEICTTLGANETRVLSDWDAAQRDLFPLSSAPASDPWLLILSAEALVSGGFQRLLAASQLLRFMPPHIQSALLVEPSQTDEHDKVAKMIGTERIIQPPLQTQHCGPQIASIFSEVFNTTVTWSSPTTHTPPSHNTTSSTTIQRTLTWPTKGSLQEVPLPRLLFTIQHLQLTGLLSLSNQGHTATLACNNGIFGTRNATQDATPRTIPDLLLWSQGATYTFDPRPIPTTRFTPFGQGLHFLSDALQNVDAKRLLQHLHSSFPLHPSATTRISDPSLLPPNPQTLLSLCNACDGTQNLSSVFLIQQTTLGNSIYAWAVYALSTDLITLHEQPHPTRSNVAYDVVGKPSSTNLTQPPKEALSPQEAMLLHELNGHYHLLQSADGYAFFQLMPGCGTQAVDTQRNEFIKKHHPDRYGRSKSSKIKELAEEVFMQGQEVLNDLRAKEAAQATQPRPKVGSIRAGRIRLNKDRSQAPKPPASRSARTSAIPTPPASRSARSSAIPTPSQAPPPPSSRFARNTRPAQPTTSRPSASHTPPPRPSSNPRSSSTTPRAAAPRPPASRSVRRSSANPNLSSPGQRPRPNPNASSPGQRPRPHSTSGQRPRPNPNPNLSSPGQRPRPNPNASSPGQRPRPRSKTQPPRSSAPSARSNPSKRATSGRTAPNLQISPDQHFKNGQNYIKVLRYQHAAEAFKLALNTEPNNGLYKAHYAWARYLADPSTTQDSVKLLNEATRTPAGAADAYLFLGQIALKRNQTMQASKHFRKVLEFDPNNADALRELQVLKKSLGSKGENKKESKESKSKNSLFGRLFKK